MNTWNNEKRMELRFVHVLRRRRGERVKKTLNINIGTYRNTIKYKVSPSKKDAQIKIMGKLQIST